MDKLKFVLVLVISTTISCTGLYENKLKQQAKELDSIINDLSTYDLGEIDLSKLEKNPNLKTSFDEMKKSLNLCSVSKHAFGISFRFNCEKLLNRKPNYGDKEYYLIKLFDLSEKENLQGNENWADCAKKPEELASNWFYLSRHLRCD